MLTESLNVELVYIILKAITRFAHLNTNKNNRLSIDIKKKKNLSFLAENEESEKDDKTIIIKRIKIKAPEQW